MTVEQELQILMNKYGKTEVISSMKDFLEKDISNEKQREWQMLAPRYGLSPNLYNATFSHNGHTFFLKEIKPSNRKYPIIAERDDGRGYKFPVSMITGLLNGAR